MAKYYAVTRSGAYLAHYGIKGMKWGVQKAIDRGDERAYKRHYRKATRKLKRLERYANNGAKYARRATINGIRAASTGGAVLAGLQNPNVAAYKIAKAGYDAYRAQSVDKSAKAAQLWKEEMERTFDPGKLYESQMRKFRKRQKMARS